MKVIVVANWKMNPPSASEAKRLFAATKKLSLARKNIVFMVTPPALYVRELAALARTGLQVGVQHAHYEPEGAHTGEISIDQAKDAKASFLLIGHAERRALGETNADINRKVLVALEKGMTPILCVGEDKRTVAGEYFDTVKMQLRAALAGVPTHKLSRIYIAYEPVWAIGATAAMKPRDMHEMSIFIRKTLVEQFGEAAHTVSVLYGGAVDGTNAPSMLSEGDVRGFLVGRSSVDVQKLKDLVASL